MSSAANPYTSGYLRLGVAAGAVVVVDQVTKALVEAMDTPRSLGPLDLTVVYNRGLAFGVLQGAWGVALLSLLAVLAALVVAWRADSYLMVPLGLLLGGGLSNLIDRLARGHVVDFIDLPHWPTFNLADTSITLGAALIVILSLYHTRRLVEPEEPEELGRASGEDKKAGPP